MSTIKSDNSNLILNADGASKDIKFQANGIEKASISSAGAFTSTSIDATKLTGTLPALDGSALTNLPAPAAGKVLQVVQATNSDLSTFSGNNSWTDSGLAKSITLSSTSSKVLVTICITVNSGGGQMEAWGRILRNGTITQVSSTSQGTQGQFAVMPTGTWESRTVSFTYLDSPASTASLNYTVQVIPSESESWYMNRQASLGSSSHQGAATSSITLIEIGA